MAGGDVGVLRFAGPSAIGSLGTATWNHRLTSAEQQCLVEAGHHAAAPPVPDAASSSNAPLLSTRENEVLARLAAGDSNKLIARALDLSPHTVKRHVANILDKLGLSSRLQAANWYQRQR